ncbi:MAG: single-stranded DNA-binding protein [Pseudomonadota bacterium]
MKAEFNITGRIGKITPAGNTLKVSIASEYGKKDKNGEFQSNPFWNTVTIFSERRIDWINKNCEPGDIVETDGTIRDTSYEKNGETVYTVTLAADRFDNHSYAERMRAERKNQE